MGSAIAAVIAAHAAMLCAACHGIKFDQPNLTHFENYIFYFFYVKLYVQVRRGTEGLHYDYVLLPFKW